MNKKKGSWLAGIITISLICLYLLSGNLNYKNQALAASHQRIKIDELFKDSGCQWSETHINAWAVISLVIKLLMTLKTWA